MATLPTKLATLTGYSLPKLGAEDETQRVYLSHILADINTRLGGTFVMPVQASPPTGNTGATYYDTTKNQLGIYTGSAWVYAGIINSVAAADTTITAVTTTGNVTVKVAKTLDHTYITDFDTQVRTSRLDQMAIPTASVSFNGQKITSLANGTVATDAAAFGQIPTTLPPSGAAGGDLTGTYPNPTVNAGAITLAKMANLAANSIIGNNTGSAATPIALTTAQTKTLLAISLTTDVSGTLQAAQEPAHTGDVTNTAGSLALTIANNAVTNAKAAQMAANTIKGNNTGSTANAADLTAAQTKTLLAIANTDVSGLGTFATQNYATPPAIGGTTPNTGSFTSINTGTRKLSAAVVLSALTPVVGHWYRLGTIPTSANVGQDLEIRVNVATASTAQDFVLRVFRGLEGSGDGMGYEYTLTSVYNTANNISNVRIVDNAGAASYVDVQFASTLTATLTVINFDYAVNGSSSWFSVGTLVDQGTASAGVVIDAINTSYQRGDTTNGLYQTSGRLTSVGTRFPNYGFSNYYNAGATVSLDAINGGMQYCSISAASNTLTLANSVAGQWYYIVVKGTQASGTAGFSLSGDLTNTTTIGLNPGQTVGFSVICLVGGATPKFMPFGAVQFMNGTGYTYP